MRRAVLLALCWLVAAPCAPWPAFAAVRAQRGAEPPRTQQLSAALAANRPSAQPIARPARSAEHALAIEGWRVDVELGDWNRVLDGGLALVADGGALARDAEAAALVARALSARGRLDEAEPLLAPSRYPEPERGWTEIERARLALEHDDLTRVFALLTESGDPDARSVQIRHANYPEAWLLVARAYARMGEPGRAGKLAQRFTELDALHADVGIAWHLVSAAARARGDAAEAERCAAIEQEARAWRAYLDARRRQVRAQPDEPLPRLGLASCWMQVRDPARARTELETLLQRKPEFCRAWFHLGEARRLTGDAAGAREAWTRALSCDPDDLKSRYNRGQLALLDGRLDEAEQDFSKLLGTSAEADPKFAGLHLFVARRALARGDSKAAELAYEKYRALGGGEPLMR